MKAFLINPVAQSIQEIEVSGDVEQLKSLLQAKSFEFDTIDGGKDVICFDEDCFINQKEGRFRLDTLAPVAGSALILGAQSNDVSVSSEELTQRVKFLS
jgi:hypothetical protein